MEPGEEPLRQFEVARAEDVTPVPAGNHSLLLEGVADRCRGRNGDAQGTRDVSQALRIGGIGEVREDLGRSNDSWRGRAIKARHEGSFSYPETAAT